MAVGQPETNLNTWGLRYVKKTRAAPSVKPSEGITAGNLVHDTPSQQIEEQVSSHGGRQSDSVKDPKGQKITHPAETNPDRLQAGVGRTTTQTTTGRREGATSTIGSKESKQEKHGQKHLTSEGKILEGQGNPKRPLGVGESASHSSGIQSPEAQTGRTSQGKPAKTGGEGKTHGALPKVKAELDLAIIKCKLLKMNNIQKDFIEDNKPTRPQYRKDDEEDYGDVKEEAKKDSGDIGHGVPKPDDGTPQGKAESDKEIKDKKLDHVYRSEDIVDKAIELINEAYDEMNKSNPVIVSDPKGKPFCSNCGRNNAKEDAKALEGTDDQQQRMVSGTGGGKAPNCPSCGHRPNKKSDGFKKLKPTYEGDTKQAKKGDPEAESLENEQRNQEEQNESNESAKEDWAKHNKADGTSTTSSEGSVNFVYSDVKEAEKQKQ